MKSYVALLILYLLTSTNASAQTIPACESIAQDADGDGFGWVPAPRTPQSLNEVPHSCAVDETTEAAPTILNKETNEEVQLVRAYWDANRDFAGRAIECEEYQWNSTTNRYLLIGRYDRLHRPLPAEKPWLNTWTATRFDLDSTLPPRITNHLWTVIDGVFNDKVGIYTLPSQQMINRISWVELIDVNGGVENGTRWWNGSVNEYHQCTDPVTNRFVPTGSPGVATTPSAVFSTESLTFFSPAQSSAPEIEREEEIIFSQGASWDIKNLAFKMVTCADYDEQSDEDNPQNTWWKFNDNSAYNIMFLPGAIDSPNSGYVAIQYLHQGANFPFAYPWTVLGNGKMDYGEQSFPIGGSDWFELVSDIEGRDVLIFWKYPKLLQKCSMQNVLYDTPYTFRELTAAEHEGFLIKTNIDTSHCTQAEETTEHLFGGGLRSCIVNNTNTEATVDMVTSEPVINDSTNPQSNPSSGENTNISTVAQSSAGGGGQISWRFLCLLVLTFLTWKLISPITRTSTPR